MFLTAEIQRTIYGLKVIRPGLVHLAKADGSTYEIEQTASGRAVCDCPDFKYRHADLPYSEGCKHVKALVEAHLIRNDCPAEPPADAG